MKIANLSTENNELAQENTHKKIGSLDQFQFMLYASKDKRLNACDLAVLFEITDRFLKKDGITYPTGAAHLARETGRNVKTVKASRAKLLKNHYLQVGELFQGSTGTAYLPNFEWSAQAAAAIKAEVAARAAKRKSRKSSGGLPTPTKAPDLVGVNSPPLSDLVGGNSPPLRDLVGVPRPPETYVGPTSPYVGGANPPALRLVPTREEAPVEWEIIEATYDGESGEDWIELIIRDDAGRTKTDGIVIQSNSESEQEAGQKTIALFSESAGRSIDSPTDLLGMRLVIDQHGQMRPVPAVRAMVAPADDNADRRAA